MDTYESLARRGYHRWWMPPVATLAVLLASCTASSAVYLLAGAVGAVAGRTADPALGHSWGAFGDTVILCVGLATLVPAALAVARVVQRRPAGSLHSVTGRLRWRWLGVCALLAVPCALLVLAGALWLEPEIAGPDRFVGWPRFLGMVAILVVVVPLQSAGEEYACRGFLLQAFGGYGRIPGVLVSALAFALLHGLGGWPGFAALVVSGVAWAVLTIVTGGLEAAIAAHAVPNLLVFLAGGAYGELDVVDDTSLADAPLAVSLLSSGTDIMFVLLVVAVVVVLRRRGSRLAPAGRACDLHQHLQPMERRT
jgi:membrane protease YdiL (CAAX protease family)